jgi:hypothetical protein
VNNKNLSAKVVTVEADGTDETAIKDLKIEGAGYTEVKVGSIITVAGVNQAFVVTAVAPGVNKATITVDRNFGVNVADNAAVTLQQGVVYKLNDGAKLDSDTEYQVQVSGVKDIAGNTVTDTNYTFKTEKVTAKLAVSSATVSNGATGVATGQKIEVVFNEPVTNIDTNSAFVNLASIADNNTSRVAFQTAAGVAVTGTYKLSSDGKTLTFLPNGYLAQDTVYNVKIAATAKSAGGTMANDYEFSFKTEEKSSAAIASAVYYDANGDGKVNADDVIRLTLNTQSLVGCNIDKYDDFEVTGPAATLGTFAANKVTVSNNYVDIVLVADSVITPGLSTIKVIINTGADTPATFTTPAVTITK